MQHGFEGVAFLRHGQRRVAVFLLESMVAVLPQSIEVIVHMDGLLGQQQDAAGYQRIEDACHQPVA